ncbi:hypothetical protein GSI_11278 [Ganoderma sinense ZZ0214-1]|uniref:BTB domain-containing protein n=1 Tax=Ganoderma sinense ZZ0214-1 TaxID=1077348 RepID=A0A2G8RYQ8_9APHY|nr:hypothetical protein GSI_11278 [Ganoderma sinense ZZ0214-1]
MDVDLDTTGTQDALPPATPLVTDEVQRDADMWFEDGNVIVIAQNIAFRFHKGVLSHHSQVFRDLFLVPQPSSSDASPIDTLDGCPVVRVSDTSYDFKELLRALYGGVSYLHPSKSASFPVLAALGRLAHKYQLDQLLDAVVQRLKRSFTTRLATWDRSGGFDPTRSPMRLYRDHAIEALNLLRLLDRPEMTPMAVYGCCQLPPKALVRGVRRADGAALECLALDDLEWCLAAKESLMRQSVRVLAGLCRALEGRIADAANDGRCPSPFTCVVAMKAWLDEWRGFPDEHVDEDPLDSYYVAKLDQAEEDETLCEACAGAVRDGLAGLRREVNNVGTADLLTSQEPERASLCDPSLRPAPHRAPAPSLLHATESQPNSVDHHAPVPRPGQALLFPCLHGHVPTTSGPRLAQHASRRLPYDGPRDGRCSGDAEDRWTAKKKFSSPLWFDDGSVVLVAEQTAFRVRSSLLSRHSPDLKKVFAVPRTSEAEGPSGCPLFHLSDTAEDLSYLLELIYVDGSRSAVGDSDVTPESLLLPFNSFGEIAKPTFAKLSAYIRLGYKYQISTLIDDAVRESDSDIPFTFSENPAADAIDTANLARTVETPSLLPVALYL